MGLQYIFLDETEDKKRFIVGGIICSNLSELNDAIYDTRRTVKSKKGLSQHLKESILCEMKDHVLNGPFASIKADFIRNLSFKRIKSKNKQKNGALIKRDTIQFYAAIYTKDTSSFKQYTKEDVYINAVLAILEHLVNHNQTNQVQILYDMVYDEFGKNDFDKRLKTAIEQNFNCVKTITPGKSNEIKELQAADICIGCIRRSHLGEDLDNFSIIQDRTTIIHINKKTSS